MSDQQLGASAPPELSTADEVKLQVRLDWLDSAQTDEEARLIEAALLTETDNGLQPGDPAEEDQP
jgi:hypothetical protein